MDCSPPGSSIHGISQSRILEWVAISFSRGSSQPQDWTHVSCIGRKVLYHCAIREAHYGVWHIVIILRAGIPVRNSDWGSTGSENTLGKDLVQPRLYWLTIHSSTFVECGFTSLLGLPFYLFIYLFSLEANSFIILWFCHRLTRISRGCTCVPHPESSFHLPPHPIRQGHPSAPALSTLSHALNLGWHSVSYMVIYMFQCYSLKSSHPRLLPQGPKHCSLYLCLFCCLAYRVIITIFLNSIYMH